MPGRFIPYGRQWLDDADIRAVIEVLQGDYLTQGPHVEGFEQKICGMTGARYCVAVANGTAALHLAVACLGVERGAEGMTSANTFVASANALVYSGLTPKLADIDPVTYNISADDMLKRMSKKIRVIIPVHFAGQPADMGRIRSIANTRGAFVIEDAAHAIGSRYKDGAMVGSCGHSDMTTFSFHPVKTITSGEGGAITTNNRTFYERLKALRSHGIVKDVPGKARAPRPWYYEMRFLGFNYRMTDMQAALGMSQLNKLALFVRKRRALVKRYNEAFRGRPFMTTPHEDEGVFSAFHLYVLQIDFDKLGKDRGRFMSELVRQGIGTQVHYIPVHLHPYYRRNFGFRPGDYPAAENYYMKALSIPLYPRMSFGDADIVARKIISELTRSTMPEACSR